jgi:RNA polymerase-binding transcription factor DksA
VKRPAKTVKKAVKAPPAKKGPAKSAKAAAPKPQAKPVKVAAPKPQANPVKVAKKKLPPPLAPSTLQKLRERLESERDRHLRQAEELAAEADLLASEREQGDTQFDEESGEGDTVNVERERDLALSASARQTVEDIERALRQMSDNTFGLCITCGDRIPLARLEVLPWAVQCVKCKARGERRR